MTLHRYRQLFAVFTGIGLSHAVLAVTLIDDFSTPSAPFGDLADGDQLFDQAIGGAGIATSRDNHTQLVNPGVLPGQVTGGQLVITDMVGPLQTTLFSVYDQAGDGSAGMLGVMPGGPYDFTGVTEFSIDASDIEGDLRWFIAVGWDLGTAGSSASPLVNGVNTIPITALPSLVDFSTVRGLQFGIINDSTTVPASVKLDNFRNDFVPEPGSLAMLTLGGFALLRRRG